MELSGSDWRRMVLHAAEVLKSQAVMLSELDAETGDGDHGIVIAMIAGRMEEVAQKWDPTGPLKELFDELSWQALGLAGGSAGPLWGSFLKGMAEVLDDQRNMDCSDLRKAFRGGLDSLQAISAAKTGDKTMMDALIPAVEALKNCPSESPAALLSVASEAAKAGVSRTRDYVAKFGRARQLKEASLGHLDPGAMSFSLLLQAWAESAKA